MDFKAIFNNTTEIVIEIGFGNGESLLTMAKLNPTLNYLGIEVYRSGIASLMIGLEKERLTNVRICQGDAVAILRDAILDNSLGGINIFSLILGRRSVITNDV